MFLTVREIQQKKQTYSILPNSAEYMSLKEIIVIYIQDYCEPPQVLQSGFSGSGAHSLQV